MLTLSARTGRERQRYVDHFRLVAGCIPYKIKKSISLDEYTENSLLVLMITSQNRSDLIFPKGGWEDDESLIQAARREAMEEAGVKGIVHESPLGIWEFRSKSSQGGCKAGGGCRGYMFALKVTEELEFWPGQANYIRQWVTIDQAFKLCRYDWMKDALNTFLAALI